MKCLNLILMPEETISEQFGDLLSFVWRSPVRSEQKRYEMRRFVVYNQSAVLFLLRVVGSRRIFLGTFSFLCLCLNCYVADILSVSSKTKACARQIFTTVSSTAFVHMRRCSHTKWKFPSGALRMALNSLEVVSCAGHLCWPSIINQVNVSLAFEDSE